MSTLRSQSSRLVWRKGGEIVLPQRFCTSSNYIGQHRTAPAHRTLAYSPDRLSQSRSGDVPLHRRPIKSLHTSTTTAMSSSTETQPLLSPDQPNRNIVSPPYQEDLTFTLPSGRHINYSIYGSPLPNPPTTTSRILLYLHGYPSTSHEASLFHRLALSRSITVLAPTRPGFGFSSPLAQPSNSRSNSNSPPNYARRIPTYHTDISALLSHLSIPRIAVLGLSGGGPYALSLARSLPPTMLSKVGLVASSPYWVASGWSNFPWWSSLRYYCAWYAPLPTRLVVEGGVGMVRWLLGTKWGLGKLELALKAQREKGQETGRDEGVWKLLGKGEMDVQTEAREVVRMLVAPFEQGARASVEELKAFTSSWGFALEDVTWKDGEGNGKGVVLWHGTKDVNAPIEHARFMRDGLVGAELREYEGNHGEVVGVFEDVLDTLLPPELKEEDG